jgi:hypothetical protein
MKFGYNEITIEKDISPNGVKAVDFKPIDTMDIWSMAFLSRDIHFT